MNLQHLADRYSRRYGLPKVWILPKRQCSSYVKETPNGYDMHIRVGADVRAEFYHEIGHVILDCWLGTRHLRRRDFRRLFGNPNTTYMGFWYFLPWPLVQHLYLEDPTWPSTYALVHPEEGFAEVIAVALSQRKRFDNRLLHRRVAYCRRVLRAIEREVCLGR